MRARRTSSSSARSASASSVDSASGAIHRALLAGDRVPFGNPVALELLLADLCRLLEGGGAHGVDVPFEHTPVGEKPLQVAESTTIDETGRRFEVPAHLLQIVLGHQLFCHGAL